MYLELINMYNAQLTLAYNSYFLTLFHMYHPYMSTDMHLMLHLYFLHIPNLYLNLELYLILLYSLMVPDLYILHYLNIHHYEKL